MGPLLICPSTTLTETDYQNNFSYLSLYFYFVKKSEKTHLKVEKSFSGDPKKKFGRSKLLILDLVISETSWSNKKQIIEKYTRNT